MTDPLSITTSVFGLIAAAKQISKVLSEVIRKAIHAPNECRRLREDVDELRGVLEKLQLFITGTAQPVHSRASMIMVEQIVAVLAGCVATFSELEAFVGSLRSDSKLGILSLLRWASKEKDLKKSLKRIQTHKSSLTLVLGILTCHKQAEAQASVDRLCQLFEQTLEQNTMLAKRLASCESDPASTIDQKSLRQQLGSPDESESYLDTSVSISSASYPLTANNPPRDFSLLSALPDAPTISPGACERHDQGRVRDSSAVHRAFEETLLESRAYQAAKRNESIDGSSTASTTRRRTTWSMLSKFSLSEMSQIAVLALPICPSNPKNGETYGFGPTGVDLLTARKSFTLGSKQPVQPHGLVKGDALRKSAPSLTANAQNPRGVFGVPISQSIQYAGSTVAFLLPGQIGPVLGQIPFILAATGTTLKSYGTVKRIFVKSGATTRVKSLRNAFNKGPDYGFKSYFAMTAYTTHDVATLLLQYLKSLPQPIIPYSYYYLYSAARVYLPQNGTGRCDDGRCLWYLQDCLEVTPNTERHVLLWLLELLSVIGSKSKLNKVSSERLVEIFQPYLLSVSPTTAKVPDRHAREVLLFMTTNAQKFALQTMSRWGDNPKDRNFVYR